MIEVFRCELIINYGVLDEDMLLLLSSSCKVQIVDIDILVSVS